VLRLQQRNLLVDWGEGFAIVSPVRRCKLECLHLLLVELQTLWQQVLRIDERGLELCSRIASLLPRLDKPGQYGFPIALIELHELEELFIGKLQDEKILPCLLLQLHSFDVRVPPVKKEGENITPADVPIPSSGIADADLFARLINCDETVAGAWQLWNEFDAEFLHGLIEQINELRRDPDERVKEYLAARFEEWKQQNNDVYKQALGIG
jgi:hypothetical protein